MMTVLATAPTAPDTDDFSETMMNYSGNNSFVERRRKYSEGYREIAAVDSLRGFEEVVTTREPLISSTCRGSTAKLPVPTEEDGLEMASDAEGDGPKAATTPSGNAISNVLVSSSSNAREANLAKRALGKAFALQRSESFLSSLPVAAATPEVDTAVASSARAVDAVAAEVIKLPPASSVGREQRAGLVSVKVFKGSPDAKLGIRLQLSKDGNLQIGKVTGFLGNSPLRMGDDILRLNGQDVSAWTTAKALKYLKEAWGWICIVVRNPRASADPTLCLASVCKSTPSDTLGISFERHSDGQGDESPLVIRGLNVAGLLGGRTIIRVGDVVESINHVSCSHLDNSTAVAMIRSVPEWVLILVRTNPIELLGLQDSLAAHHDVEVAPEVPKHVHDEVTFDATAATEIARPLSLDDRHEHIEPSLLTVTLYKNKKSDILGLSLVQLDGDIYIKKVTGALGGSILREGMILLAINQKLVSRMTLSEATYFLNHQVGSITLLAHNPHGNPKHVQAMVYKKTSVVPGDNLVGVSFKGSAGRQLKVCEIREDGLFVESCLNVGDSILQINDIPCRHSRPKEAVDLVRASERCVSILAKSKSKTGIIVARLGSFS